MTYRPPYVTTTARFVILSILCSAMSWPATPNQVMSLTLQSERQTVPDERAQHSVEVYKWERDSNALVAQIGWLTNHPDWVDMAGIINSYTSTAYVEGQDSAIRKTNLAMRLWEDRWGTSADEMFRRYVALVGIGQKLDVHRRTLHRKEVQLIEGFHRERFKVLRGLKDSVQRDQLGKAENELRAKSLEDAALTYNSFGMGHLGLYERRILKN
jgi:hypothetical protein